MELVPLCSIPFTSHQSK